MKHVIAYHGTSLENVESILKEGFRVKTYFAWSFQDALAFGGPCVFSARFNEAGFQGNDDGWQFHLRDPLSSDAIVAWEIAA